VNERGPALAALVQREVRNKLTTGLKNPRRNRQAKIKQATTSKRRTGRQAR
jgi:hypothetical protein